jgi:hypothetical protein
MENRKIVFDWSASGAKARVTARACSALGQTREAQ